MIKSLDQATALLSQVYPVMRESSDKRGTPLYEAFMQLLRYVEDDVIAMGGDCPE